MKTSKLLMIPFSVALICAVSFLSPIAIAYGQEAESSFYFIRLFGGIFPIPSDYVLNLGIDQYTKPISRIRFLSPADEFAHNHDYSSSESPRYGTILVGSYKDFKEEMRGSEVYVKSKESIVCADLYIEKYSISQKSEVSKRSKVLDHFLIHDDNEYFFVSDPNPHLWKELIEIYNSKNKIDVSKCNISDDDFEGD